MPWVPLAAAAISAAGSVYAANKASKTAAEAAKASQVDVNALDEQTRRIAQQNAQQSAELERLMTPEVPQLRTAANQGILQGLAPTEAENAARAYLMAHLTDQTAGAASSPLLAEAARVAQEQLALGGELPLDVRNLVARQALSRAGTFAGPGGGLGMGRDIVARDLGLTSLDLLNSRLGNAAAVGGQQAGLSQFNSNLQLQNNQSLMQRIAALQDVDNAGFGRQLAAGTYAQNIQQPIVGLDPTAYANLTVGNANNQGAALANRANIQGTQGQNYMNLAGNLLGGYVNRFTTPTTTYKPAPQPTPQPFNYSFR